MATDFCMKLKEEHQIISMDALKEKGLPRAAVNDHNTECIERVVANWEQEGLDVEILLYAYNATHDATVTSRRSWSTFLGITAERTFWDDLRSMLEPIFAFRWFFGPVAALEKITSPIG